MGQYDKLWNFNRIIWYFTLRNCSSPLVKMELKCHFSHSVTHPLTDFFPPLHAFRLCWFCPVYQPSLSLSPSWWFSPSSYTTAAVTVATGVRAQRRRRRMKMPAQVTVTAARRGGASAVSPGWRWRLSRCAGEKELLYFLATHTQVAF